MERDKFKRLERLGGQTGNALNKGGRPKGAKNKRSPQLAKWLIQQHGDPAERLARCYAMDTAELAAQLDCSLLEAAQMQLTAARDVMPYVHEKRGIAQLADAIDSLGARLDAATKRYQGLSGQKAPQLDMPLLDMTPITKQIQ